MIRTTTCIDCAVPFTYNQVKRQRIRCDLCRRERRRAQNQARSHDVYNQDGRKKRRNLVHRHRITHEQADLVIMLSYDACSVCGRLPDPEHSNVSYRSLHLDHDHESGLFRGLICGWCNLALGFALDDPDRLEALARYLRKPAFQSRDSFFESLVSQ